MVLYLLWHGVSGFVVTFEGQSRILANGNRGLILSETFAFLVLNNFWWYPIWYYLILLTAKLRLGIATNQNIKKFLTNHSCGNIWFIWISSKPVAYGYFYRCIVLCIISCIFEKKDIDNTTKSAFCTKYCIFYYNLLLSFRLHSIKVIMIRISSKIWFGYSTCFLIFNMTDIRFKFTVCHIWSSENIVLYYVCTGAEPEVFQRVFEEDTVWDGNIWKSCYVHL